MLCYPGIDWLKQKGTVTGLNAIIGDDRNDVGGVGKMGYNYRGT